MQRYCWVFCSHSLERRSQLCFHTRQICWCAQSLSWKRICPTGARVCCRPWMRTTSWTWSTSQRGSFLSPSPAAWRSRAMQPTCGRLPQCCAQSTAKTTWYAFFFDPTSPLGKRMSESSLIVHSLTLLTNYYRTGVSCPGNTLFIIAFSSQAQWRKEVCVLINCF